MRHLVGTLFLVVLIGGCWRGPLSIGTDDPSCGPGITSCYGVCSDIRFDPSHCGGCAIHCVTGELCDQGQCVALGGGSGSGGSGGGSGGSGSGGSGCSYPEQTCGSTCTDTDTDSANCGGCGLSCAPTQMCSKGVCVQGCVAPQLSCAGTCVDTDSDLGNCGSCGHVCEASQACNGGSCVTPCASGTTLCKSACIDLSGDPSNCGGCGITCASGEQCHAGLCRGSTSVWPTLGGDVHHTGYNPVETGHPPLTLAWSISLGTGALWPAVSDGSTIYVSSQGAFSGAALSALSPTDGHTVWRYNFGDVFSIGQATVQDGHVYIAQSNNGGSTYMFSFVASNGTLFWSQPFGSQWEHYWAPLVVGGRIYFDGGTYGGLYALDQASGARVFDTFEEQWDEWSPLFFDNHVYTFTDGNVRRLDPTSGAVDLATTVMWNWNGYSMNTSPISDGTRMYIISPPNLIAFNPTFGTPAWTANGAYASEPAVAEGVVYSITGGQLRANDATSGTLLWSFAGDSALDHPPVVAAGHVYVASETNVYAVDVATHSQSWTNTPGGWLSIAGGELLVASRNGVLTAWSLTP